MCKSRSVPIDLDVLLAAAVRHGNHDAEADDDDDTDHGPRGADIGQDAQLPQGGQHAASQNDEPDKLHARPFHGDPPCSKTAAPQHRSRCDTPR